MISLIRTQLWASLGINHVLRPGKRAKSLGLAALVVLGMMPGYIGYVATLSKAHVTLTAQGLPLHDLLLTGIYNLSQLMVLLVGVPIVYSTLFQANDLSLLLPLPFRPWQILVGKLSVTYVMELLVGLGFLAPALVLHAIHTQPHPAMLANALLSALLLPAIPLAICAILTIAVVNIPGIGKSKWFWYLAIMVAVAGASFAFVALTSTGPRPDVMDLVQVKMQQLNQAGRLVPGSVFAMRAMVLTGAEGALSQLLNLAVVTLYGVVLLGVGERLYIGPILKGGEGRPRAHRRAEVTRSRSFLASYMRKEAVSTLKDPAVAMNALGAYLGVPVAMLMWTVVKIQSKGKVDILRQLLKAAQSADIATYLPYVAAGTGLALGLIGASSSLFSASYSKDGRRLWIEKTLPVPPFDVFKGKLLMGLVLVSALNLVTTVALSTAVPLGWTRWIYAFILSEVVLGWSAVAGLCVDCRRPKLVWKDTVQAVKQNMNVMLGFGVTLFLGGANAGLLYACYRLDVPPMGVYGVALAANVLLLAAALAEGRRSARALERVQL